MAAFIASLPAWTVYVFFVIGLVLIIKGGDWFVDGASWVAEATGIPKFIVGATIVSLATTLPEIIVSTLAAVEGHAALVAGKVAESEGMVGMAIGNGIGSVIANTAMIMAVSLIFIPAVIERKKFTPKALLLIASVLAVLATTFFTGGLQPWGAVILLIIFTAFIVENVISAKKEMGGEKEEVDKDTKTVVINLAQLLGGAVAIFLGSRLMVNNATIIAKSWGVSEAIIGVTIVAIGTSLPELVTAVTAIAKKQASLSVGNIIGANVIDTVLILPICSFVYGGTLGVSDINRYLDFPMAILVTLIAIVPTIIAKKFRRWQGVAMLVIYIAYLVVTCAYTDQWLALFGVQA